MFLKKNSPWNYLECKNSTWRCCDVCGQNVLPISSLQNAFKNVGRVRERMREWESGRESERADERAREWTREWESETGGKMKRAKKSCLTVSRARNGRMLLNFYFVPGKKTTKIFFLILDGSNPGNGAPVSSSEHLDNYFQSLCPVRMPLGRGS